MLYGKRFSQKMKRVNKVAQNLQCCKKVKLSIVHTEKRTMVKAICGVNLSDRNTINRKEYSGIDENNNIEKASVVRWVGHVLRTENRNTMKTINLK